MLSAFGWRLHLPEQFDASDWACRWRRCLYGKAGWRTRYRVRTAGVDFMLPKACVRARGDLVTKCDLVVRRPHLVLITRGSRDEVVRMASFVKGATMTRCESMGSRRVSAGARLLTMACRWWLFHHDDAVTRGVCPPMRKGESRFHHEGHEQRDVRLSDFKEGHPLISGRRGVAPARSRFRGSPSSRTSMARRAFRSSASRSMTRTSSSYPS
jgi:hypothetical protein